MTTVRAAAQRVLGSPWAWWLLIAIYLAGVLAILAPVLLSSIGGDDAYWVLQIPADSNGSLWTAFWEPLSRAFDFDGQARTTSLSFSERRLVGLITMDISTALSIPPSFVWALLKVVLLGAGVLSVALFLRQLRFRDASGAVRGIGPTSIALVVIALPLAIAMGAKAQHVGQINGWMYYPTLSYAPLAVYLGIAGLALAAARLLDRNFRRWVAPVVVVFGVLALVVNLSYELAALAIPVALFVVVLQPLPDAATRWLRWRGRVTVVLALGVTYAAIFVWLRWRISQMVCQVPEGCYSGTVIQLDPATLVNNFVGALPGNVADLAAEDAERFGRAAPGIEAPGVLLALVVAATMIALGASWWVRHRATDRAAAGRSDDIRGLVLPTVLALLVAVGSSFITGISAIAVETVLTPAMSYRTNVVTWSALALGGLLVVRMLTLLRWRAVRVVAVLALAAVMVTAVAWSLPRNLVSAQADRLLPRTLTANALQWEVARGDLTETGDARRCEVVQAHLDTYNSNLNRFARHVQGAYSAFELYWGEPFCSTGLGTDVGDSTPDWRRAS